MQCLPVAQTAPNGRRLPPACASRAGGRGACGARPLAAVAVLQCRCSQPEEPVSMFGHHSGASVQQERKQNKSLFKQQRTMQRMLHLNYQDGIWFAECEDKAELLTTIFWKRGGDTIRRSRTMKSPSKKKELSSKKAGWHRKGSACSGEANSTWRSFE
ncbi:uncharacterized protein [Dermacentor albipictus]|uniref:uncharacterized protein isoform X2 n=1 Tax=Dermacentor albipictus TaxID=60249 RepID=UPI0038FD302B